MPSRSHVGQQIVFTDIPYCCRAHMLHRASASFAAAKSVSPSMPRHLPGSDPTLQNRVTPARRAAESRLKKPFTLVRSVCENDSADFDASRTGVSTPAL